MLSYNPCIINWWKIKLPRMDEFDIRFDNGVCTIAPEIHFSAFNGKTKSEVKRMVSLRCGTWTGVD